MFTKSVRFWAGFLILAILFLTALSFLARKGSAANTNTPSTTLTNTPAPSGCTGSSAYYVSNSGSDSNAGTSSETAWKTLTKVNGCAFNPGTTIYFAKGSSWSEGLVINNSGTSGSKITYSAYGSGTYPTFSKSGGPAFTLNASYVVINNFKVVNSGSTWGDKGSSLVNPGTDMGSLITKNGTYNIVQNSEFTGNTIGLKIWGTNNRVTTNNFHDNNVLAGNNITAGSIQICWGALGVNVDNSYNEIDHNSFTGNRGACSVPAYGGWDGGAIEVDGFNVNKLGINIHDNTSSGNQGFIEASGTEYTGWITNNTSNDYEKFLSFDIGGTYAVNPHDISVSGNKITLTLNPAGDGCWPVIGFWDGSAKANAFTFTNNKVRTKCAGILSPYAAQTHSGNTYCRTDGNIDMWWTYGSGDTFDCTWQ